MTSLASLRTLFSRQNRRQGYALFVAFTILPVISSQAAPGPSSFEVFAREHQLAHERNLQHREVGAGVSKVEWACTPPAVYPVAPGADSDIAHFEGSWATNKNYSAVLWRSPCPSDVNKSIVYLRVTPTIGTPFICSSSFTLLQATQNAVKLTQPGGSSFCSDLYIPQTFWVTNWNFDPPFEPNLAFTLIHKGVWSSVEVSLADYFVGYTVSISKMGTGQGIVTSSPVGINCGVTCAAKVQKNSVVSLTAVPASGSAFSGWSGACAGRDACKIMTTNAASATAFFTALPSSASVSQLVVHYFNSILRRSPDFGGQEYWESEAMRVAGLGANVSEVWYAMAMGFYSSPEYAAFKRDNHGFVTDLYNTFFNRTPDAGGLAYWAGLLEQGMPREVAISSFMFSPEFVNFTQGIFGSGVARAEINTVVDFYRGLLSRLPDSGGFDYWVGEFRSAQCSGGAAVLADVDAISHAYINSAEYANRGRTNAQFVGDMYNAFMRRGGDIAGVLFWISQLDSGAMTREMVRRAFVATPEFSARAHAVIEQGCLN